MTTSCATLCLLLPFEVIITFDGIEAFKFLFSKDVINEMTQKKYLNLFSWG